MKVGEYVRTNKGITKIIDIREKTITSFGLNSLSSKITEVITDKGIIVNISMKHNPDIRELIEEGDYVNGEKVHCIYDNGKKQLIYDVPIKSIVTKEQFESMEYKVGK